MAPSRGLVRNLVLILLFQLLFHVYNQEACSVNILQSEDQLCGLALMQGFRDAMEDRALCLEPISISLSRSCKVQQGPKIQNQVGEHSSADANIRQSDPRAQSGDSEELPDQLDVRAFAVFDGHGGAEASTFAADRIRQTLQEELTAVSASNKSCSDSMNSEPDEEALFSKGLQLERVVARTLEGVSAAMNKALLRLDAEFQTYALSEEVGSGTTACVAVLVYDKWLQVANIGDSRATLCTSPPASGCPSRCPLPTRRSPRGKRNRGLCARDLTSDHRFDRADEVNRVQSAGGIVLSVGGVPRLMGVSMLSRAIGDVDLKQYGMIADPELSEWVDVSDSDVRFLVLASDGVYEDIAGGQCVCDLIAGMGGASGSGHVETRRAAIPLGPSLAESEGSHSEETAESVPHLRNSGEANLEEHTCASQEQELDANAILQRRFCAENTGPDVRSSEANRFGVSPSLSGLSQASQILVAEAKPGDKSRKSRENDRVPKLEAWTASGKQSRQDDSANAGAYSRRRAKEPHSRKRRRDADGENGPGTDSAGRRLPPAEIAERLRDTAFLRGSMDNIAALVVDFQAVRKARESRLSDGAASVGEPTSDAEGGSLESDVSRKVSGASSDVTAENSYLLSESILSEAVEKTTFESEAAGAVVQVGESPVAELRGFRVYISGQVVYGEGSEWCYLLVELVSGLPALPGPNPQTLAVSGETRPPAEVPTTETDPEPFPTGIPDVQNALPELPSAWGTTLELYHRHLVATVDPGLVDPGLSGGLHGLRKFLDVVASVPVDPGGWTGARPAWTGRSEESTGEEVGEEWTPAGVQREEGDHRYRYVLRDNFAKGSFGEVWRAVRMPDKNADNDRRCRSSPDPELDQEENCRGDAAGTRFILKRLLVEKGGEVRLSGLREKFFGEMLMNASATWQHEQTTAHAAPRGESEARDAPVEGVEGGYGHLVRYVDSFEMHSGRELWLVFRDEGKSLREWMYDTPAPSGEQVGLGVVTPSAWWRWLRTDVRGRQEMKSIMWQLLVALRTCHQHDVTHRDLKPANLLLVTRPAHGASDPSDWQQASNLSVRLIDFGSAWSPLAHHLYGTHGPSRLQETPEYSPPEALFAQEPWLPRRPNMAAKYDTWSAGVLFLELLLGTPHVFQVSSRTRALLDRHLASCRDAACKELAYTLRAFLELCIYPPAPLASLFPARAENLAKEGGSRNETSAVEKKEENREERTHWFERLSSSVSKLIKSRLSLRFSTTSSSNRRPGETESGRGGALAWQCSEESFLNQLRARDPFGEDGDIDVWGARLLRRMLHWNPEERISADEALQHAYFRKGPPRGYKCAACGREFESRAQYLAHAASLHDGEAFPSDHCS